MEQIVQSNSEEIDIPKRIFSQLIQELTKKDVPQSVIDQLKKTIITEQDFSEKALRLALISNSEL
ncbi:hypothetical protein [Sphingobacterium sp. DR205]|uniref:hypothetical protein n=1 Tax=Sphingobacterium sp. DR205 TaxID=2713573 RepID=UPI0013E4A773|nr:hypothetical protein [Sphingobacterium sp. DR205]QIH33441.1 hypothetical protein G6053_11335 [Sphingobacterium sp. DR205]